MNHNMATFQGVFKGESSSPHREVFWRLTGKNDGINPVAIGDRIRVREQMGIELEVVLVELVVKNGEEVIVDGIVESDGAEKVWIRLWMPSEWLRIRVGIWGRIKEFIRWNFCGVYVDDEDEFIPSAEQLARSMKRSVRETERESGEEDGVRRWFEVEAELMSDDVGDEIGEVGELSETVGKVGTDGRNLEEVGKIIGKVDEGEDGEEIELEEMSFAENAEVKAVKK